jgi:hypothetical protein
MNSPIHRRLRVTVQNGSAKWLKFGSERHKELDQPPFLTIINKLIL